MVKPLVLGITANLLSKTTKNFLDENLKKVQKTLKKLNGKSFDDVVYLFTLKI